MLLSWSQFSAPEFCYHFNCSSRRFFSSCVSGLSSGKYVKWLQEAYLGRCICKRSCCSWLSSKCICYSFECSVQTWSIKYMLFFVYLAPKSLLNIVTQCLWTAETSHTHLLLQQHLPQESCLLLSPFLGAGLLCPSFADFLMWFTNKKMLLSQLSWNDVGDVPKMDMLYFLCVCTYTHNEKAAF